MFRLNTRFLILLTAILLMVFPTQVQAALPPDSLHLNVLAPSSLVAGQTFEVQVTGNIATPAYGFGWQWHYDPAYLEVVPALDPDGESVANTVSGGLFASAQRVVNKQTISGSLDVVYTLLNPAPSITGEGTLASITFRVLQEGDTEVRLLNPRLISIEGGTAHDISLTLGEPVVRVRAGKVQPPKQPIIEDGNNIPWLLIVITMLIGLLLLGMVSWWVRRNYQRSRQKSRNKTAASGFSAR